MSQTQQAAKSQFTRVRFVKLNDGLPGYWIRRCNTCGQEMVVSRHSPNCQYWIDEKKADEESQRPKGYLF